MHYFIAILAPIFLGQYLFRGGIVLGGSFPLLDGCLACIACRPFDADDQSTWFTAEFAKNACGELFLISRLSFYCFLLPLIGYPVLSLAL